MSNLTICGIAISNFARKPTAEELAKLLAHADSEVQAQFFMLLGEQLKFHCGFRRDIQLAYVAEKMLEEEKRCCADFGTELIAALHEIVGLERAKEGETA